MKDAQNYIVFFYKNYDPKYLFFRQTSTLISSFVPNAFGIGFWVSFQQIPNKP